MEIASRVLIIDKIFLSILFGLNFFFALFNLWLARRNYRLALEGKRLAESTLGTAEMNLQIYEKLKATREEVAK